MNWKQVTAAFLALICIGAGGTMAFGLNGDQTDGGQAQVSTAADSSASQAANAEATDKNTDSSSDSHSSSASSVDQKQVNEMISEAQKASRMVESAKFTVKTHANVRGKSMKAVTQVHYRKSGETTMKVSSPSMESSDMMTISKDGAMYYDASKKTAYNVKQNDMAKMQNKGKSAGPISMSSVKAVLQQQDISYQGTTMVNGQQAYILCTQVGNLKAFEGTELEGTTTTIKLYISEKSDLPLKVKTTTTKSGKTVATTTSVISYEMTKECEEPLAEQMNTPDVTNTKQSSLGEIQRLLFKSLTTK